MDCAEIVGEGGSCTLRGPFSIGTGVRLRPYGFGNRGRVQSGVKPRFPAAVTPEQLRRRMPQHSVKSAPRASVWRHSIEAATKRLECSPARGVAEHGQLFVEPSDDLVSLVGQRARLLEVTRQLQTVAVLFTESALEDPLLVLEKHADLVQLPFRSRRVSLAFSDPPLEHSLFVVARRAHLLELP